MNLGTYMPDVERRKPIAIEVCRSKVNVTLSIHMFATRLSHLWCVTDFIELKLSRYDYSIVTFKLFLCGLKIYPRLLPPQDIFFKIEY
jgi:hypothetical protein